MIRLTFLLTARLYWWFGDHAPSNRLIRRVRTQPRLMWTPISLAVAVGYLAAVIGVSAAIDHGAPRWLYAAVLMAAWSGLKIGWLVPASLVWAARVRWSRRAMTARTAPILSGSGARL